MKTVKADLTLNLNKHDRKTKTWEKTYIQMEDNKGVLTA